MKKQKLLKRDEKLIKTLVEKFQEEREAIEKFGRSVLVALTDDEHLKRLIHSSKSRIKDPTHLEDKLKRKIFSCKKEGSGFDITSDNLLEKITDLAGIRILHLYTAQISKIDPCLRNIFHEHKFEIIEGPFARTWDDESRNFFAENDIETEDSESLYTSVHYVIASNSRKNMTCEIQVRTLSEEVWGEVNHMLNYPHQTDSLACREQLKVLARVTSSVSRLVDSIVLTDADHRDNS